ncbi:XF1762 family protein [Rhodoferax antarcticus]|uniref:Uncharacterized protein n=1 Tax=Rhodoferax antarcticus ANT.BR TaxID=1111071 RepID=A0A1Q8Y983_9BURK|nr:XF1762 family protein [Rhodoferax antarcticus]OLP04585.1 hypothetical protein BLL52_4128 [Rhodoferax antarcticus ANT.BR]
MAKCIHCGDDESVEIHEVYGYRDFLLDTCCESFHKDVVDFLNKDPKTAAKWLMGLSDGILLQMQQPKLRRVIDDGLGSLMLDWNLTLVPVEQRTAKEFVKRHHRHCPPPAGWRFGAGVSNGNGNLIGVIMVGRPVARTLNQNEILEVNRLCVRDDIPQGLVWNACSLLYGWASKQARQRGFKKIITYVLESESGTTLRAAGWVPELKTSGGSWNRKTRQRVDKTTTQPKIRWTAPWCQDQFTLQPENLGATA